MHKIVVGITGASGAVYGQRLLTKLVSHSEQWSKVAVVMTKNGMTNWALEIGALDKEALPFDFYSLDDFSAPFASGSAKYATMIICPCSMGVLGRIAHGVSGDLITRAADVILKERRRLILVPRETPLSLIHLRNMVRITEAGGIIVPAIPSFYGGESDGVALIDTVVDRVLDLAGFEIARKRWGE